MTELASATLSGEAYGLVVGLTGGTAGAWSWTAYTGKLLVAGGTSLLNSWNEEKDIKDTLISLGSSLIMSTIYQGVGYGMSKLGSLIPKNSTERTFGDVISELWSMPEVKTGIIRLAGGIAGSILNDYF